MADLAGVIVSDYFLLECLAREGTVETYRARPTTKGGYDVLLRLFKPHFQEAAIFQQEFVGEVEKVWRCQHKHLLPLLEFGTGEELLYTATAWPEGVELSQLFEQGRTVSLTLALRIFAQLSTAVAYLHEHEIVHGNIQPASIFVRHGYDVFLTNFAMRAASQEGAPLSAGLDSANPCYAAPEQGLGVLRPSSDIYALGIILYTLLTGAPPYQGDDAEEIMLKHTQENLPALHVQRLGLPDGLEKVLQVALAKAPDARYPTAGAFAKAVFRACTSDTTTQTVFATTQRRIQVRARRTNCSWTRALSLV